MSDQEQQRLFGEMLAAHQSRLYGFLFALVGNREDAAELFQETSLTLWRRIETFQPGSNFYAWASTIAHLSARNFLRRKRLQCVCFNEEMLDSLTATQQSGDEELDELYLLILQECREQLGQPDRLMLDLFYTKELAARQIADQMGRSRQSVCNSLSRIRRQLLECIEKHIAQKGHP